MSEQQFNQEFEKGEKEQLMATYLSRQHRDFVVMEFPARRQRKK